jgi:hypothetical protein
VNVRPVVAVDGGAWRAARALLGVSPDRTVDDATDSVCRAAALIFGLPSHRTGLNGLHIVWLKAGPSPCTIAACPNKRLPVRVPSPFTRARLAVAATSPLSLSTLPLLPCAMRAQ